MTTFTDDDVVRDALEGLREHEPPAREVAAVRRRAALQAGRRRRERRRAGYTVIGATAVLAGALALLPSGGQEGPRGGDPLAVAAAVAAEQLPLPPTPDARFRYAKLRETFTYRVEEGGKVATEINRRTAETWVSARWKGRMTSPGGTRSFGGDRELAKRVYGPVMGGDWITKPHDAPFAYGDGPLAELDPAELPEDREAIARALADGIRNDRWGPYPSSRGKPGNVPEDVARGHTAYSAILLLVYARLSPAQRAALIDTLANTGEARDLGEVVDDAGRTGRGVELEFPHSFGGGERFRVIFDPDTSEVLQWSTSPLGGETRGSPARDELVLDSGYARAVGERP